MHISTFFVFHVLEHALVLKPMNYQTTYDQGGLKILPAISLWRGRSYDLVIYVNEKEHMFLLCTFRTTCR